jgi:hypothetical protein
LTLTAAQRQARQGKLTGSRVGCLMRGDRDAIMRLWLEMTGQEAEEDLSHVWPVRLGEATEQLQLDWFERGGSPVTRRGEVVVHPECDWAAATLDGWIEQLQCPIECKHVGGRDPTEVVIERYQPQCHWEMLVTRATQCALTIIRGADEPVVEWLTLDTVYATELMHRASQFMSFVNRVIPPVVLPPAPPPVSAFRDYDMSDNDSWRHNALEWIQVKGAADTAKECEKTLKALVPLDAKKCTGFGVRVTRDRAGRLSLREDRV